MIYFFQFEVTPTVKHSENEKIAGAIVDCWIKSDSLDRAELVARERIRSAEWIVDDANQAFADARERYEENSRNLIYFEQALIDGEVLVFHTYPIDDQK
jgi:hypothetical protein